MNSPAPWREYLCKACGLVYSEELGDPDSGLPPGTRFEDIPDDWLCPLCGVTKADFELKSASRPTRAQVACPPIASALQRLGTCLGSPEHDVVVVGAGMAGWAMVEALRESSPDLDIAMVTACAGDRYERPMLSVAQSKGLSPAQLMRETGAAAAARLGIRLYPQTHLVSLQASLKTIRTTQGSMGYGSLVLAMGTRPVLPEGFDPRLVWRVQDLETYRRLVARLEGCAKDLLIVGAGLIGAELASDFAAAGHRVTLTDREALPMARLPMTAADRLSLAAVWAERGLQFLGGSGLQSLRRLSETGRLWAELACGRVLEVDEVLVCAGQRSAVGQLEGSGLILDRDGVVVEEASLRASLPDVYALGDCASVEGRAMRFVEPIRRQARAIAAGVLRTTPEPYTVKAPIVQVKTAGYPFRVAC